MDTIKVDAKLWKSVCFLIDGLAIMGTLRQVDPQLNQHVVNLSRAIEQAQEPSTTTFDA